MNVALEEPAGHQDEDVGLANDEAEWAHAGQSNHQQTFDEVDQDWSVFDEYEVKPNIEYETMLENVHFIINGEDVIKVDGVVIPYILEYDGPRLRELYRI